MRGSGGYRCTWGRRRGERRGESRERLETKQRRSATLKGRPERQNRRQGPTKRHPLGHRARQQKEGGITTSKLVPDARTTMTRRDLTSEVEWDRVLYSWYGRALSLKGELCTLSNLEVKANVDECRLMSTLQPPRTIQLPYTVSSWSHSIHSSLTCTTVSRSTTLYYPVLVII